MANPLRRRFRQYADFRMRSSPKVGRQVLGPDLNCSESGQPEKLIGWPGARSEPVTTIALPNSSASDTPGARGPPRGGMAGAQARARPFTTTSPARLRFLRSMVEGAGFH